MIQFTLPFPPSMNHYWRAFKGRKIISESGRRYRTEGLAIFDALRANAGRIEALAGPVEMVLELYPPDKRRRDCDNHIKAIGDLLTHAGIWGDDSQVKRLVVIMHDPGHEMRGTCRVTLSVIK